MDVRMPDGTILQGVPDDMPKEEILNRYRASEARRYRQEDFDSMPWYQQAAIGAGQSVDELLTGVKGIMGGDTTQARADQAMVNDIDSGWKTAGNIAGDVAMASVPGLGAANVARNAGLPLARAAQAALAGETLGAGVVEGVQNESLASGATAAGLTAAGGVLAPKLLGIGSKAADELYQQGVKLTPGQRWGGIIKGAEEILSYVPGTAKPVQKAKDAALSSWNGVIRSIKGDVSGLTPHQAIEATKKAVKSEYEDIFSGTAKLSDDLLPGWASALDEAQKVMPPKEYKALQKTFSNLADPIARGKGSMDAKALQSLDSGLGKLSSQAFKRGDGIAADVFKSAKETLRQAMPDDMSKRLAQNNEAYSKFKVLESATGKSAPSKRQPAGTITPGELLTSASVGRRPQAAVGRAPLQSDAALANEVLSGSNKVQGLAGAIPAISRPFINEPMRRGLTSPLTGQMARSLPTLGLATSQEERMRWMADQIRRRR
jgi:hypothetical protein